jgi:hypothetical protein
MRLPFTVANCDSESKEHPASNLHDPSTPYPWVSAPFPLYAQELTIAVSSRPLSRLTSGKDQPQQHHQLSRPSSCVPVNCIRCLYGDCQAHSTTLFALPQTFPARCLVHHPPSTSMPLSVPINETQMQQTNLVFHGEQFTGAVIVKTLRLLSHELFVPSKVSPASAPPSPSSLGLLHLENPCQPHTQPRPITLPLLESHRHAMPRQSAPIRSSPLYSMLRRPEVQTMSALLPTPAPSIQAPHLDGKGAFALTVDLRSTSGWERCLSTRCPTTARLTTSTWALSDSQSVPTPTQTLNPRPSTLNPQP